MLLIETVVWYQVVDKYGLFKCANTLQLEQRDTSRLISWFAILFSRVSVALEFFLSGRLSTSSARVSGWQQCRRQLIYPPALVPETVMCYTYSEVFSAGHATNPKDNMVANNK